MSILNVNEQNFNEEVLQAEGVVLADIWAPWCGPCRMLGPVVEEVANELSEIKVVKINADEAPKLAQKYNVATIPTLLVLKNGEVIKRSVGLISKAEIIDLIS